jgi:SAM-dependent methyltransferase
MTSSQLDQCPACGATWSANGTIRVPVDGFGDEMLNGTLRRQLPTLTYERCGRCSSLIATDVRRDPALLDEIYRQLPQTYWQGLNPHAGFHRVIEGYLRRRGVLGGDLWDVGCGSGGLLASFGPQWVKAGIEPGLAAVARARENGLNVVAGTASSLRLTNVADVAMLIDVVEHLPDPEAELRAVFELLRPGGIGALFTGTADAWTARFAGPRWYYLHCIGHVTVFGRSALATLARRCGFIDITTHQIEHPSAVGLPRWLRRIGGNVLRRALGRPPGAMHCFRDHQLVLAAKPREN